MSLSLVAISGSLRERSTNTRLLQEIGHLVDSTVSFTLFTGLEALPPFNPDKESNLSAATSAWLSLVRNADALIVATPEYAHGIPGVLKNALDWLVGADALIDKPFCLYRSCPRSIFAPAALLEVLHTMSGKHVVEGDVMIDLRRDYERADSILAEAENTEKIVNSISYLHRLVSEHRYAQESL
jgi:chromate reductase, NAD(P)H dehydrogenase (quinone)